MTRDEIIALIVRKAGEYGLVPYELLGGAIAESELDPEAWRQGDWPDWSAGLFQQTVKYAEEGDHSSLPDNVVLIRRLYSDPVHATDVAAAKFKYWRYDPEVSALQAWCAYNLPASYRLWPDVPNVGQRENYRAGLAQARAILGVQTVSYDPSTPIDTQNHDWDCAEQSTLWGLTAMGRHPSDAWVEGSMLGEGVESTDVGLKVSDGSGLAAWITEQYGDPSAGAPALTGHNVGSVSFDDVKAVAGTSAVLLGGRGWGSAGHWTGVRRYDAASDTLVLANPGGTGPVYGQQTLSRQQFAAIGPCAMVVISSLGAAPLPVPVPTPAPDPRDALIAQLKADLADARSKLGVASVDYVKGIRDLADALERLKPAA